VYLIDNAHSYVDEGIGNEGGYSKSIEYIIFVLLYKKLFLIFLGTS
jgi:hypothetical protein